MHHPTDRIIHTTAFVTPVVEHWLEQVIACGKGSQHVVTSIYLPLVNYIRLCGICLVNVGCVEYV